MVLFELHFEGTDLDKEMGRVFRVEKAQMHKNVKV